MQPDGEVFLAEGDSKPSLSPAAVTSLAVTFGQKNRANDESVVCALRVVSAEAGLAAENLTKWV